MYCSVGCTVVTGEGLENQGRVAPPPPSLSACRDALCPAFALRLTNPRVMRRVFPVSFLEQTVLDLGVLPHLQSLLRHPKKNIRKVTDHLTGWARGPGHVTRCTCASRTLTRGAFFSRNRAQLKSVCVLLLGKEQKP